MVPDADKLKEQLRALNEMQGPVARKWSIYNIEGTFLAMYVLRDFDCDELSSVQPDRN
jgi:hypothetical protein